MRHDTTGNSFLTKRLPKIIQKRKKYLVGVAAILVVLLVGIAIVLNHRGAIPRHPNIAAFCKTLQASQGVNGLNDKVQYLRSLEEYAPNDIYPTVHTMRLTYEQAQAQPSNYFGLELGITGSINTFNEYAANHCSQ